MDKPSPTTVSTSVPPPPTGEKVIDQKVPINIFTGFLGSGKTTIISHLIDQVKDKEKLVYIKNEVGDVEVDTKALAGQGVVGQEMLNGCVCCTLVGPLMSKLDELIEQNNPDRIILESSGTAEPTNLAVTITGNRRVYRDSLVSVIDTLNYDQEPKYNDHYQLQAKVTDLLILNKVEEVPEDHKQRVIEAVRSTNSSSPMIEAKGGKVAPDLVFGLPSKIQVGPGQHVHDHDHMIESFTINLPQKVNIGKLEAVLDNLSNDFIRVKGVLFAPEPVICNQAYKRRTFSRPSVDLPSGEAFLYFIGLNIAQHKASILEKIEKCTL